jgi:hypothetical protein
MYPSAQEPVFGRAQHRLSSRSAGGPDGLSLHAFVTHLSNPGYFLKFVGGGAREGSMYTTWNLKEPETDPVRKYSAWKPGGVLLVSYNLSDWNLRTASTHPLMLMLAFRLAVKYLSRTKSLVLTPNRTQSYS